MGLREKAACLLPPSQGVEDRAGIFPLVSVTWLECFQMFLILCSARTGFPWSFLVYAHWWFWFGGFCSACTEYIDDNKVTQEFTTVSFLKVPRSQGPRQPILLSPLRDFLCFFVVSHPEMFSCKGGNLGEMGLLHLSGIRTIQGLINSEIVRPEFEPRRSSHRNYYFNCQASTTQNKTYMCMSLLGLP